MDQHNYIKLYEKYLSGKCSGEEKKLLDEYADEFDYLDIPWDKKIGDQDAIEKLIFQRITEQVNGNRELKRSKIKWLAIAASLLLFASAGWLYFLHYSKTSQSVVNNRSKPSKNDILPGSSKAVLTLANGSQILLDNARDGVIARQGNTAVDKTKNGKLVYNAGDKYAASSDLPIVYNTITTPRGGEYQVILPDGTKAWLNAASSLKFPTLFKGRTRDVEVTGEVYFEVVKNKEMPFKVLSNGTEIEVLGTHFDIMTYQDEPKLKATLLEGEIKFRINNSEVLLKPGEQAIASHDSKNIVVKQADLDETMAWRNGYFIFQDENIKSIMRKVSRWYDVDIAYQGNMDDTELGGKISRYNNISDLLKTLELTGTAHFKIEERRITVMK